MDLNFNVFNFISILLKIVYSLSVTSQMLTGDKEIAELKRTCESLKREKDRITQKTLAMVIIRFCQSNYNTNLPRIIISHGSMRV